MKNIYQSFEEIAKDMKNGEYLAHQLSDHSSLICSIWQDAITEFAKALDSAGIKLEENPEIYENFWANIDKALSQWKSGLNRRKPFSKCLGQISKDEAKQRYNFSGEGKLVIPSYETFSQEYAEDYYLVV